MHSSHFVMNLNIMPQWKLGSCQAKRLGCTISLLQQDELEGIFGDRSNTCKGTDPSLARKWNQLLHLWVQEPDFYCVGIIQVILRWNKSVYVLWDSADK